MDRHYSALEDNAVAVVSAVFNAVDDQIGSVNTGATVSTDKLSVDEKAILVLLRETGSARARLLMQLTDDFPAQSA